MAKIMAVPRLISTVLFLVVAALFCADHGARAADPFAALPFEVVATTPAELLRGEDFILQRGQALQVVFSRPVRAIADWDTESQTPDHEPFSISIKNSAAPFSTIASQRFVTTYILRIDPLPEHDGLWPTDLQLALQWNRDLKTWDGAEMSAEHKRALKVSCMHDVDLSICAARCYVWPDVSE